MLSTPQKTRLWLQMGISHGNNDNVLNIVIKDSAGRFIIDVEQKSLTKQQFGTVEDFPQFSQFEFPTINEK